MPVPINRESDAYQFDLLALRLEVQGPIAADRKAIRALARSPLWLETRNLLRSHEFTEAEIATLMGLHRTGCPCWACVMALHKAVRRRVGLMSDTSRKRQRKLSTLPLE